MARVVLPRVLILCGGFGTRLAGVIKDVPKPMAPIQGRPFLEYQIEFLRRQGFSRFTLLTGHRAEVIEKHFGNGRSFGVEITYSHETKPLGTGGAVRQALLSTPAIDESFLVLNGDSFFTTDLVRFLKHARGPASLALKYMKDLSRYGSVRINKDYRIEGFVEKSAAPGASLADGFINAGIYFIHRSFLKDLPEGSFSIEKEVFEPLARHAALHGVPCGGKFVDIGTPESFAWSQDHLPTWLQQKPRPCLFLDRDGVVVEHVNYLHEPSKAILVPEVTQLIRHANRLGWPVAVVSNQSGVGRGLFTEADCRATNLYIDQALRTAGAVIHSWNCCYEHPREGMGSYRRASLRRKPEPGMLLEACDEMAIDLSRSLMIGDNQTDQIHIPGLQTFLIRGDFEFNEIHPETRIFENFASLHQASVDFLDASNS